MVRIGGGGRSEHFCAIANHSLLAHPVYSDGKLCISILVSRGCGKDGHTRQLADIHPTAPRQHAPGQDEWGYEDAGERWLPVHTVESIVSRLGVRTQFAISHQAPRARHCTACVCHLTPISRRTRPQLPRKRRRSKASQR